ncbi:MAG: hypothetical protein KAS32_21215 [Candidatus Peribacteraceae bacterium]|nr:hypothetical protein [Candidatus Peribacteraceae bacterium]
MISIKERDEFNKMIFAGGGTGTAGAYSTGNDGIIGAVLDTLGFNEVVFRLALTGKSTTGSSVVVSIRESDTATGTYTAITNGIGDSTGFAFGGVNISSGTTSQGLLQQSLINRKRFLKAFLDSATGATGLVLTQIDLDSVMGSPKVKQPVTQTALTTAT